MKKRNFKIITFALGTLFLGASCSESFLDTEMKTNLSDVNYYQTKNDAWTALVGCYDGLQRVWSDGIAFPFASEVLSDNCFGGMGSSDVYNFQMIDEFDKQRSPSDIDLYAANWKGYYKAIYRCNMFIGKMDQIKWDGDRTLRKQYESETRFLRAYCYFDMARLWGNVPLLTEPTSENVSQAAPEEVYKVIAKDLKFACDSLSGKAYSATDAKTNGGRVTKYAAEALLARVYLYYTGYYGKSDLAGVVTKAQALAYLEDVVTNGGYGLVSNFANLWPAASLNNYVGEDNKETVFAIKYTYTSNYDGDADGNHWLVMMGIREQSIYPYGLGWGGCTVNPKLWNAYDSRDTRKVASIISIDDEKLDFQKKDKQREYTGYYVKKYTPMSDSVGNSLAVKLGAVNFMIGQYQDYVSIRYSDVLLMAAELGSAKAQDYFDLVRKRAYGDSFVQVPVSQSAIMAERRLEFAFEGIRYWDLLRQGVSVAANTISESGVKVYSGGVETTKVIKADGITATKGLQQIPYNQITLSNNVLIQNAGW